MDWQQIVFTCDKHQASLLEEALIELGSLAITLQDAGKQDLFELAPGSSPQWDQTKLTALFNQDTDLSIVINSLQQQFENLNYTSEQLPDQQWERAWLDNFKPMQFGDNTWICPTGFDIPDKQAINILLDPGLAFGTGTHATTALCLTWIDQHDLIGKTIIDYGCGSGILAIAAAKHGAKQVIAVDHDPQAVIATQQNAERNNIDDKILTVYHSDNMPECKADVVIANILAAPLIELASSLVQHCQQQIVLSGILHNQQQKIIAAYQAHFKNFHTQRLDDWLLISAKKS